MVINYIASVLRKRKVIQLLYYFLITLAVISDDDACTYN